MKTFLYDRLLTVFAGFAVALTLPALAVVYNYFAPGGALSGNATSQIVNLSAGSSFVTGTLPLANLVSCSNTQIPFDNSGSLACSANLTFNTSTNTFTIGTSSGASALTIGNTTTSGIITQITQSTATSTNFLNWRGAATGAGSANAQWWQWNFTNKKLFLFPADSTQTNGCRAALELDRTGTSPSDTIITAGGNSCTNTDSYSLLDLKQSADFFFRGNFIGGPIDFWLLNDNLNADTSTYTRFNLGGDGSNYVRYSQTPSTYTGAALLVGGFSSAPYGAVYTQGNAANPLEFGTPPAGGGATVIAALEIDLNQATIPLHALLSGGTTFTLGSGTGACATTSTLKGGAISGSFLCTGTAGPSTQIINLPTATNGWSCWAHDDTALTVLAAGSSSTTTITVSGIIATTGDKVTFGCIGS